MLDMFYQFAAEETAQAAEESSGLSALGLDPVAILIQSGTFILLFFLIKRYALDAINDKLNQRDETINEGLENARKASIASQEAVAQQQKLLKQANDKAAEIIGEANQKSGQIITEAQSAAGDQAGKIVADARTQITAEVERARTELKSELVELVATATETVTRGTVDAHKDKQLIESALSGGDK